MGSVSVLSLSLSLLLHLLLLSLYFTTPCVLQIYYTIVTNFTPPSKRGINTKTPSLLGPIFRMARLLRLRAMLAVLASLVAVASAWSTPPMLLKGQAAQRVAPLRMVRPRTCETLRVVGSSEYCSIDRWL